MGRRRCVAIETLESQSKKSPAASPLSDLENQILQGETWNPIFSKYLWALQGLAGKRTRYRWHLRHSLTLSSVTLSGGTEGQQDQEEAQYKSWV